MVKQKKDNKIIKNDNVIVIAGDDKGKQGSVVKILFVNNKKMAVVSDVNLKSRAVKQNINENGFIKKEYPIDISNLKKYTK